MANGSHLADTVVMISILQKAVWTGAVATALTLTGSSKANTIVFNNALQHGTQQDYVLGMDFNVNSAVTVTDLGAFDSDGNGFFGTISVGIFKLDGTQVGATASFSGAAGTLIGGSRFLPIAPFTLSPGTYSIVAAGFTLGDEFSGNTGMGGVTSFDSVGGKLAIVLKGGRWDNGNTFQLPTQNSGGYGQGDPVFQAGTFAVAVPDGGATLMMLGLGVAAIGWVRRQAVIKA